MGLLDILFPKTCVNCGRVGSFICENCFKGINPLEKQFCPGCHEPSMLGMHHPTCRKRKCIDQLFSGYWYKGVGNIVLKHFKFTDPGISLQPYIHHLVTNSLDESLIDMWQGSLIVPIPLHWIREKRRGFNQSHIIAGSICQFIGGTSATQILTKDVATIPQSEMPLTKRKGNIADSFSVTGAIETYTIPSVVLVDDVVTTGSTLTACAKVLRSQLKIERVYTYTLFRGR